MSRQVKVNPGYSSVLLPNGGTYKAGDIVTLTDLQYQQLSSTIFDVVLTDLGDPSGNATSVPPVGTYTLDSQGRVLTDLDGTTYTYDDANGGRIATVSSLATAIGATFVNVGNFTHAQTPDNVPPADIVAFLKTYA